MEYLKLEQPIAELNEKIEELRRVGAAGGLNLADEIERLEKKCQSLTESIFSNLKPQDIVQLARHPNRPHTSDYIDNIFTDYTELNGDRHSSRGSALSAGIARFDGRPVMVIGHEKGRSTKDRVQHRFGMANPEGFRRALRLMKLAERFKMPVFTFIDTPGANPGIDAEEHNQSEAIARNLFVMSRLKTPIICTITGEGCSGGALAIGVGDRTLMLQYSYYSVISPEGCASILWKSPEHAKDAAEALNLTSDILLGHGLIDAIIPEPLGAAHRDPKAMYENLTASLRSNLAELENLAMNDLIEQRYQKYMQIGRDA
jgi:acetyl-CoA carboxylase carboxyl transferase subunit alpha